LPMEKYKTHVFVCTNSPDKLGKCGSKGSESLRKGLKDQCRDEFGKSVRVNSAGCLGFCEHGIAAVIYPAGEWLLDLKDTDAAEVMEKIRKHTPPEDQK
jgi:(2Fe-2S) ferredoxin